MSWSRFREIFNVSQSYCDASIKNLEHHQMMAKQFLGKPCSMLLVGPPGTGKTYFMFSLINTILEKKPEYLSQVLFINGKHLSEMLDEEHKAYGTCRDVVRKMVDPKYLFIDDFGVEGKSDRIERNYYDICDKRLADHRITIFSTNLADQEIKEVFGVRIDSRLKQCMKVVFDGKDQRKFE